MGINAALLITQLLVIGLYVGLIIVTLRSIARLAMDDWLKLAWVLVVIGVPFLGMIAYWIVGKGLCRPEN